jgi:hypothetical protein
MNRIFLFDANRNQFLAVYIRQFYAIGSKTCWKVGGWPVGGLNEG